MKILTQADRSFAATVKKVASRGAVQGSAVEKTVRTILQAVQRGGDRAVLRYTKQFDRVALKAEALRVSPEEIKEAYHHIRKDEGDALRFAAQRVTAFHERQRTKTWMYQDDTATLGQVVTPVDAVGVYVPGGKAVYPSSVLMCAIPAKVAGVERIVMVTPPQKGPINPYLLVAADIAGVTEIYRVGGVQAVAALAYGTKTIAKVDKIVGPGNAFVAAAKRLVSRDVSIDFVAGPTEIVIIAADGDPRWIAADLLAQAEHDVDASAILLTTSRALAEAVAKEVEVQLATLPTAEVARPSIENNGAIVVLDTLEQAVEVSNALAPEHLALHDETLLDKIRHAGAVFVGASSPESAGDYASGPNHVLPTSGAARLRGGLSAADFVKVIAVQQLSPEGLAKLTPAITALARAEGLEAHARSAEVRSE